LKIPKITLDEKAKKILPWMLVASLFPLVFRNQINLPYHTYFVFFVLLSFCLGTLLLLSERAESKSPKKESKCSSWYKIGIFGVTIFFFALTLGIPFFYSGSYIDEYFHIYSGIELFQSGHPAPIYDGSFYTRGIYVSWLVGLFLSVFGESLLVAKMVPAVLGCVSFVLLFLLARIVLSKKILIPALLFVFAINPYLIFEHFYIRFYVFTEVLLLAVLFLGCQILLSLRSSDFKRLLASVLGFATINIIAFLWAKGMSGLPVLLASAIIMSYIFLFESKNITLPGKNLCARIGNRFLQDGFYARAVILSLAFCAGLFLFQSRIFFLLHGEITYSSAPNGKYDALFFGIFPVLTVLFLLSFQKLFQTDSKESSCAKMMIITAFFLFFVHLFSSESLQIYRAIIYLLPLFLLVCFVGIETIFSKSIHIFVAVFLCIGTTVFSYPSLFLQKPGIPHEQGYVEYKKAYDFVKNECAGKTIIETALIPYASHFHGVTPDYAFITEEWRLQTEGIFVKTENGYKTNFKNVPVLMNPEDVDRIAKSEFCYIQRTPMLNRLVDLDMAESLIQNAVKQKEFSLMWVFVQ
jgi:hypothetical protein